MNYIKVLLVLLLSTLWMLKPVYGQQADVQMNRMHRDINIMKSILKEMFKVKSSTATMDFGFPTLPVSVWNNEERVQGIYVNDYGIILFIPNPASSDMMLFSRFREKDFSYSFYYDEHDSSDSTLSEESVISQITDFFENYAAASVNQLRPNERVTVLFGGKPSAEVLERAQHFTLNSDSTEPFLPTISVTALKSDLDAHENNRLSADAFRQRLRVSSKDGNESDELDLKIMANVLKTALTESNDNHIRIGKGITFLKIDDFGAIFFLDIHLFSNRFPLLKSASPLSSAAVSGTSHSRLSRSAFSLSPDSIASIKVDKNEDDRGAATITIRKKDRSQITRAAGRGASFHPDSATNWNKEIKEAYQQLVHNMKTYLVDYGPTLSSVKSDQTVLLSASLASPAYNNIPNHIDLQIKKSVLEALSQGKMSRDEAIRQVVVHEY